MLGCTSLRFLGTIAILYSAVIALQAQDFRFSQPYSEPLSINPALVGNHSGLYRIGSQYRSQWFNNIDGGFSGFQTSVDARVRPFPNNERDYFGVGFEFFNSREGNVPLSTFKFLGALTYHKVLDRKMRSTISAGLSFGSVQTGYDFSELVFEDQYVGGQFTNPTGESNLFQNVTYGDLGFALNYLFREEQFLYSIGVSVQHINEPQRTFFDIKDAPTYTIVPRAYVLNTFGRFALSPYGNMLNPRLVFAYQKDFYKGDLGLTYSIPLQGEGFNNFHFGASLSMGNTVDKTFSLLSTAPVFGVEIQPFTIGLSYDITLQPLSTYRDYTGGLEISFIYIGQQEDSDQITGFSY